MVNHFPYIRFGSQKRTLEYEKLIIFLCLVSQNMGNYYFTHEKVGEK